jgi:hypothetical protein
MHLEHNIQDVSEVNGGPSSDTIYESFHYLYSENVMFFKTT